MVFDSQSTEHNLEPSPCSEDNPSVESFDDSAAPPNETSNSLLPTEHELNNPPSNDTLPLTSHPPSDDPTSQSLKSQIAASLSSSLAILSSTSSTSPTSSSSSSSQTPPPHSSSSSSSTSSPSSSSSSIPPLSSLPVHPLTLARRSDLRFEFSPPDPQHPNRHNSFRMVFGAKANNPNFQPPKKLVIRGRYAKGELHFVRQAFQQLGFLEMHRDSPLFDACWAIRFLPQDFARLSPHQKVNFMPGTSALCRKDRLHQTLVAAQRLYGFEDFSFWPVGYCLPAEYPQFVEYFNSINITSSSSSSSIIQNNDNNDIDNDNHHNNDNDNDDDNNDDNNDNNHHNNIDQTDNHNTGPTFQPWILKPPLSACGRRIRMITSLSQVDPADPWIVQHFPLAQRYIPDPLMVDGFKCTLRIYAAVTGVDPLRVYVFPEGLVRICSSKYALSEQSFADPFTHLDSIDINEQRTSHFLAQVDPAVPHREGLRMLVSDWMVYQQHLFEKDNNNNDDDDDNDNDNDDDENEICKSKKEKKRLNPEALWHQIHEVVVKSILAAETGIVQAVRSQVKRRHNCFDLFGFDILVDSAFKCWLLEINHTPSMSPHTALENKVKVALLSSLLRLVDYPADHLHSVGPRTDALWPVLQRLKEAQRRRFATSGAAPPCFRLVQQITREQLWLLVMFELEQQRKGQWQLAFPNAESEKYYPFMMKNNNTLLLDWVQSELHTCHFSIMLASLEKLIQ